MLHGSETPFSRMSPPQRRDPRRPDRVTEFRFKAEEIDFDPYALLGLATGLLGVFFQAKLFGWFTLLFVLASFANTKHSQADYKGIAAQAALVLLVLFAVHSNKPLVFPWLARSRATLQN